MNINNVSSTTILLIGSGRLATHLKYWNSLLSRPNNLIFWDRSQDPDFRTLQLSVATADMIWLAISDSNLIAFYETHLLGSKQKIVHFSGAIYDARLSSAHPMMSFPKTLLPDSVYAKIGFAIQGAQNLHELMPGFENPHFPVEGLTKPLYHALCVVAGNFPQLLWNEAAVGFQKLNIPESIFHTYIAQVLNNYLALKEKALTGPLIRNDKLTMQKNESALVDQPKLQNIYRTFKKEFRP